jgi:hypothetical protein
MAAGKKLTTSQQFRQKIIRKMTGKTIKPSEQKFGGIRLVTVSYEPVRDAEAAFREANAARLAKAIYDRVLDGSSDPVVVTALLTQTKVDSDAGALLVKLAWQAHQMKKQRAELNETNEEASRDRAAKDIECCKIADELNMKRRGKYYMAERVRRELAKRGTKTSRNSVVRAFTRQKYL